MLLFWELSHSATQQTNTRLKLSFHSRPSIAAETDCQSSASSDFNGHNLLSSQPSRFTDALVTGEPSILDSGMVRQLKKDTKICCNVNEDSNPRKTRDHEVVYELESF